MAEPLEVTLEFTGGAELLFGGVRKHVAQLPPQDQPWTMRQLLPWIRDNLLKERPELFIYEGGIRPGILVLVNDSDWELLDGLDYKISPRDTIVFISTLHGG